MRPRQRLKPFLAPVHDLGMRGLVGEGEERIDRIPDRHVDDHAGIVEGADVRRVAAVALQPPDETGRALGKRIDRVELGHEIGQQWIVERRPGARDIQLGEMALAHHGSGRPSKLKNLPLSAGVSVEIFSRMLVTLSRGVISAPGPPMSVRTQPGWNSTTVMPREARSTASVFATMLRAALLDR